MRASHSQALISSHTPSRSKPRAAPESSMPTLPEQVATPPAIYDTVQSSQEQGEGDPWEDANRQSYAFSNFLDRHLVRPVAMAYKHWLPQPIRRGVHNVLTNLEEPVVLINDVLQARPVSAMHTGVRFITNTTVGVAGVFDVASHADLPHHDNDFGVTLGRYHVPAGPYLYIPIIGPSSVRDVAGDVVDFFLDPIAPQGNGADALNTAQAALDGLDSRSAIDQELQTLNATSFDPYVTIRSLYMQTKQSQVQGGQVNLESLPDFPDPPPADEPAPATNDATIQDIPSESVTTP